jgi:long-chain acyl-CoA synthetase
MNIYETLAHNAKRWPDKMAVHDEYGALTYRDLFAQTEQLRTQLAGAGVTENTGIALIAENNRYFMIGLYAAAATGATVMPLAPQQQPDEIRKALNEAQLHFILSDNQKFSSYGIGTLTIEQLPHTVYLSTTGKATHEHTVPSLSGVAFMRFTSGTTGTAKCVILTHQSVYERTEAANQALQITEADNVVWVLPMAYHFIVSIVLYIRYGAGIIVCNDFLAEHILGKIQNHGGTFLYASPMHIRLLAGFPDGVRIPSLRRVISTTTAVNPAHCRAFREKYHVPVSQAFGIIEVGLPIINIEYAEEHPEAVGRALPAYEVAILDPDYNPVPPNTVGLLGIRGPGMFDGYLSPPTKRSEVLKNGWFVTGDLASCTADGLIAINGREKSMINVSGNKVFPDEVEAVINAFPVVVRSRVYGQTHPLFGEIVVADVMLTVGDNLHDDELLAYCRKALSAFKIPQRINIVSEIELTGSGKVKR